VNSDFSAIEGSDEYPEPGSFTTISCRRLFLTIATASAPVPPPPEIITAGAEVYPAPGSVILIEVRTEVLNS